MERIGLAADALSIDLGGRRLEFDRLGLRFLERGITDVFSAKNNKTLRETVQHHRYSQLSTLVDGQYFAMGAMPLGEFLAGLKRAGDPAYKKFLNPYGDAVYCRFRLEPDALARKKGIYLYRSVGDIVYIGRSKDPFSKRIDQGYGTIHPKNCYLDGQSTNCHLNALIAQNTEAVSLFVCPLSDDGDIEDVERQLLHLLNPRWNSALVRH